MAARNLSASCKPCTHAESGRHFYGSLLWEFLSVTSIATEGSHQIFQPMISAWKITIKVKLRAPARHIMSCLLQRLNDIFRGLWWRLKSLFLVLDKAPACPIFFHVKVVLRDQNSGGKRRSQNIPCWFLVPRGKKYRTFRYRYISIYIPIKNCAIPVRIPNSWVSLIRFIY